MNRTVKVCLAAAAALILIGGLLFVGAMASNHWDTSVFGGGQYETVTYTAPELVEDNVVLTLQYKIYNFFEVLIEKIKTAWEKISG